MKRTMRILVALGLVAAMSGLLAGTASAQDQSITISPAAVAEAGEVTVTVTGADWPAVGVVILPCPLNDDGTVNTGACDQTKLTFLAGTPEDGAFTQEVTVDVPEGGIGLLASEAAAGTTIQASAAIVVDPELANTGVESGLIAIIGLAVVAGGAMVVGTARRRG